MRRVTHAQVPHRPHKNAVIPLKNVTRSWRMYFIWNTWVTNESRFVTQAAQERRDTFEKRDSFVTHVFHLKYMSHERVAFCHTGRTRTPWHDSPLYVWHDSFMYVWRESSICETWLIHMCDMTHSCVWHDSFICVTWLIHMCDMTHSCVWHASFVCETWLFHARDMTRSCVWHDSSMCVSWLIHRCQTGWTKMPCISKLTSADLLLRLTSRCPHLSFVTHSYVGDMTRSYLYVYVRHDSFEYSCISNLQTTDLLLLSTSRCPHQSFVTLSYVGHDSFICETWLVHMWDMTCSYVRHDSFICETWLQCGAVWCSVLQCVAVCCSAVIGSASTQSCNTEHSNESCLIYKSVMPQVWLSHIPHMNASHVSRIWVTNDVSRIWVTNECWATSHIWMHHT